MRRKEIGRISDVVISCTKGGRDRPIFIAFEHPTVITTPTRIMLMFKLLQQFQVVVTVQRSGRPDPI